MTQVTCRLTVKNKNRDQLRNTMLGKATFTFLVIPGIVLCFHIRVNSARELIRVNVASETATFVLTPRIPQTVNRYF